MRRATHLALMLLMAAGPGVVVGSASPQSAAKTGPGVAAGSSQTQAPAKKKPSSPSAKSGNSSNHKTTKSSAKSRRRERGQKTPTPERITEIQQALVKDGSYNTAPNGKWDDATVGAMKRFQEANGLNPSGKLDAKTLQKLGLGSSTSGAAAPVPPANSSASTNLPSPPAVKQQ
jgi:murein L,D-transpeptidase YcbB/YkuD